MPKLSVIVPVYNTEKYLSKCLDSLKDLKETEIVIVNDGSTDGSENVINEYIKDKSNVVYFKKENTGVADTRNFGIEHATGDYTLFVDSDDYIEHDLYDTLCKYMEENIDVIKFKLKRVNEKGETIKKVEGAVFDKKTGEEAFAELYPTDVLLDSPCVYLFKREYIKQNQFKFDTSLCYHEDFGLIPLIVANAGSVVSVDYYGYNYVQSTNSITRNEDYIKTLRKMDDALKAYDNMVNSLEKYSISTRAKDNLKIYYTNAIIIKLKELKPEDQDIYISKIKQRKMIQNIKVRNVKQLVKRVLLTVNIKTYLKKR
ncbi:MAG: glycosyltransferase [Clostridia bacterium]|nr:glycosyltransferase [Clostridia bacterium]